MDDYIFSPEELADKLHKLVIKLKTMGRSDLILRSIGFDVFEEMKSELAKQTLSRLVITKDFRFLLPEYGNIEVDLQPVHKAVYLLFLNHPEDIEFKKLVDYRDELRMLYRKTAKLIDVDKIEESVRRLTEAQ